MSYPDWIDEEMVDAELGRSGMKIDPFADSVLPFYTTIDQRGVHFLRRQFCLDGLAAWDGEYLIDRLTYIENNRETEQFSILRANNYLIAGSGSSNVTLMLYDFIK